jgi:hypothetical protein
MNTPGEEWLLNRLEALRVAAMDSPDGLVRLYASDLNELIDAARRESSVRRYCNIVSAFCDQIERVRRD